MAVAVAVAVVVCGVGVSVGGDGGGSGAPVFTALRPSVPLPDRLFEIVLLDWVEMLHGCVRLVPVGVQDMGLTSHDPHLPHVHEMLWSYVVPWAKKFELVVSGALVRSVECGVLGKEG